MRNIRFFLILLLFMIIGSMALSADECLAFITARDTGEFSFVTHFSRVFWYASHRNGTCHHPDRIAEQYFDYLSEEFADSDIFGYRDDLYFTNFRIYGNTTLESFGDISQTWYDLIVGLRDDLQSRLAPPHDWIGLENNFIYYPQE